MSPAVIKIVADALVSARKQRHAVDATPFAEALSSPEQAYAVQDAVAGALGWFGPTVPKYWKSGGANREATLTHAALPPAGIWTSPAVAGDYPFNQRYIEAEVAVRLGRDVDAATAAGLINEAEAAALVDAMAVSIEVVDSRWTQSTKAPALLRLADLQSHGALILGEWQPWRAIDWSRQVCRVAIGSQPVVERRGTHPLGTPTWGLGGWLRHATRHEGVVAAGSVVTTGTWVGILDAKAGDRVVVEFDGIGSAQVQL